MDRDEKLKKIIKILKDNLRDETYSDGSGEKIIGESLIPEIADDILKDFANVIPSCDHCGSKDITITECFCNKCNLWIDDFGTFGI